MEWEVDGMTIKESKDGLVGWNSLSKDITCLPQVSLVLTVVMEQLQSGKQKYMGVKMCFACHLNIHGAWMADRIINI